MISSGINLVMTVIGFAVSTMFIVFVCTRLICARIHLSTSRRSLSTASRADLSILERGIHDLEPVVVSSFPTRKFGDTSSQDTQCTVCLGEYQEKDVQRVLPYCGHTFHVHCIDIWLKQQSTCPVCRISLRESPDLNRTMTISRSTARLVSNLSSPRGGTATRIRVQLRIRGQSHLMTFSSSLNHRELGKRRRLPQRWRYNAAAFQKQRCCCARRVR